MPKDPRILLVDDDANFRRVVQFNLQEQGYALEVAARAAEALEKLRAESFDLLITDIKMPGGSGLDLLESVRGFSRIPVIVITAFGSIETAVDAMKRGATDFITKPFNREELFEATKRCLQFGADLEQPGEEAASPGSRPRAAAPATGGTRPPVNLVGESEPIAKLRGMIERLAQTDVTVLLQGESGTGKEVVARLIHERSPRSKTGQFVAVNSSAIPRELLESELFGHVKGSFTGAISDRVGKFEQAGGGTMFLDEIGDMPLELQAKMLRALQEREIERVGGDGRPRIIDVRVVAATNRDLGKMVQEGTFREDLYYRIAVVKVGLPALRERPADIRPLAEFFLERYRRDETVAWNDEAISLLGRHGWPGNVRELENVVQHALALRANANRIDPSDLPEYLSNPSRPMPDHLFEIPASGIVLDDVEAKLIESAIRQTGGNQTRAAELLGISRQTLIYRLQKYGITKDGTHERSNSHTG